MKLTHCYLNSGSFEYIVISWVELDELSQMKVDGHNLDGPTVWPDFFNEHTKLKVIRKQGHFLGWNCKNVPSESGRP